MIPRFWLVMLNPKRPFMSCTSIVSYGIMCSPAQLMAYIQSALHTFIFGFFRVLSDSSCCDGSTSSPLFRIACYCCLLLTSPATAATRSTHTRSKRDVTTLGSLQNRRLQNQPTEVPAATCILHRIYQVGVSVHEGGVI